ncbi:MAG: glutamine amidotransferase-related protein [Pseudomonadales bacterium]
MIIGILQCDDVQNQLQPTFGNYPHMLQQLLGTVDPALTFKVYDVRADQYPQEIDECDAYISTGSKHSVTDSDPWIQKLIAFVSELDSARKKFAGICFGHQLIAMALKGQVALSEKGWGAGVAFNQVSQQRPWMQPYSAGLDIIVSHQEQISELPARCQVIAASSFCPAFMIEVENHMLGIQGHPEWSKDYSRALTNTRLERIPAQRVREAFCSLNASVDSELLGRWIVNFFKAA